MANTFQNLVFDAGAALNKVARESIGFIPAVTRDPAVDMAAEGQTIQVPIVRKRANQAIVAGVVETKADDQNVERVPITMSKYQEQKFFWTEEQIYALNRGVGYSEVMRQEMEQAIRQLVAEMEEDIAAEAVTGISRLYGTGSVEPFSETSKLEHPAALRRILRQNGAPRGNISLVLNHDGAFRILSSNPNLYRADQSGDDSLLRRADFGARRLHDMTIRETFTLEDPVHAVAKGTAYRAMGAYAKGARDVTVDTGATADLSAGEVISFTGDDLNRYVIKSVSARTGNANARVQTLTLNQPLVKAVADDAVLKYPRPVAGYMPSIALARESLIFACRPPAFVQGSDNHVARFMVNDDLTNISLEFRAYKVTRAIQWKVAGVWGVQTLRPEFIAGIYKDS